MSNTSPSGPTRALADLAFGSRTHVLDTSRPLAWLSPEEMAIDLSDPVQRRFGDYELIEKIGQGGMGVVYRARQHGLDRDVALKLLAAGPWASDEFIERFRREAKSAARMQHPNIVEIYEFGHRDGLNYFSMRLIEGQSLAEKLQADGAMAPKDAARLLRTLAEAMDYAHRLGVLHLDLKPANVLLTKSGEPLIADFGLARRIDAGHEGGSEISGTPSYMAPEQAQLEWHPLSASTDIYGLGAILYECLTGRPPFLASSAQDTLERVVMDAPKSPRTINKAIPADLEAICLKCLGKEPAQRYATARDFAEDLRRFAEGDPVSVRRLNSIQLATRWARREPRVAMLMVLLLLSLGVGLVGKELQQRASRKMALEHAELGARVMASLYPVGERSKMNSDEHLVGVLNWADVVTDTGEREVADRHRVRDAFIAALIESGDPHRLAVARAALLHTSNSEERAMAGNLIEQLRARSGTEDLWVAYALSGRTWGYAKTAKELRTELAHRFGTSQSTPQADRLTALALCADWQPDPACTDKMRGYLAQLEPDNAFALLLAAPDAAKDPAGAAEQVRRAAAATRFDDHTGTRLLVFSERLRPLQVTASPRMLAMLRQLFPKLRSPSEFIIVRNSGSLPGVGVPLRRDLANLCNPASKSKPKVAPSDCLALARLVRTGNSHITNRNIHGNFPLRRLSPGSPEAFAALKEREQELWMWEHWGRAELTEAATRENASITYATDVAKHGMFEAELRQLERSGVARFPPAEFLAREDLRKALLLPEQRPSR